MIQFEPNKSIEQFELLWLESPVGSRCHRHEKKPGTIASILKYIGNEHSSVYFRNSKQEIAFRSVAVVCLPLKQFQGADLHIHWLLSGLMNQRD